jgi:hypothetical protein
MDQESENPAVDVRGKRLARMQQSNAAKKPVNNAINLVCPRQLTHIRASDRQLLRHPRLQTPLLLLPGTVLLFYSPRQLT